MREPSTRRSTSATRSVMAVVSPADSHACSELFRNCRWRTSATGAGTSMPENLQRRRRFHLRRHPPALGDQTSALAPVAVPALPLGLDVLAEIVEDEPRAALRALAVVDHRAQLRPILDPALLVVG